MAVKNIILGNINAEPLGTDFLSTTLNFTGPFNVTSNATISKLGNICVMTITGVYGVPTATGVDVFAPLPQGYYPNSDAGMLVYLTTSNGTTVTSSSLGNLAASSAANSIIFHSFAGWDTTSGFTQGLHNSATLIYILA